MCAVNWNTLQSERHSVKLQVTHLFGNCKISHKSTYTVDWVRERRRRSANNHNMRVRVYRCTTFVLQNIGALFHIIFYSLKRETLTKTSSVGSHRPPLAHFDVAVTLQSRQIRSRFFTKFDDKIFLINNTNILEAIRYCFIDSKPQEMQIYRRWNLKPYNNVAYWCKSQRVY